MTYVFWYVRSAESLIQKFHASDLLQTFGAGELQDYLINFINNLDPNVGTAKSSEKLIYWPRFTTYSKSLLTILDGPVPLTISKDDFRRLAIDFLIMLGLKHPM